VSDAKAGKKERGNGRADWGYVGTRGCEASEQMVAHAHAQWREGRVGKHKGEVSRIAPPMSPAPEGFPSLEGRTKAGFRIKW
jgi:hypothetical protein